MSLFFVLSFLIPTLVAVAALVVSKVLVWRAFRRTNRINKGWEKLYKKLLQDGWVPPRCTKWFGHYVDAYHPEYNPSKCLVIIAEEE